MEGFLSPKDFKRIFRCLPLSVSAPTSAMAAPTKRSSSSCAALPKAAALSEDQQLEAAIRQSMEEASRKTDVAAATKPDVVIVQQLLDGRWCVVEAGCSVQRLPRTI